MKWNDVNWECILLPFYLAMEEHKNYNVFCVPFKRFHLIKLKTVQYKIIPQTKKALNRPLSIELVNVCEYKSIIENVIIESMAL